MHLHGCSNDIKRQAKEGVDNVFTSAYKEPLTTSGLYQFTGILAKMAGVTGRFNPPAWQHFFGAKWARHGGDISALLDMMGHSSIEVTKIYTQFDTSTIQEEHQKYSPLSGLLDS